MKCEGYRKLFSDFIDGELSEEGLEDFRDHLKSCEACRKKLKGFRLAQMLLKLLPKKEAPPELWGAIEAKVRFMEKKPVFFFQSIGVFERLEVEEELPPPTRIYGLSFGTPRWGQG